MSKPGFKLLLADKEAEAEALSYENDYLTAVHKEVNKTFRLFKDYKYILMMRIPNLRKMAELLG